MSCNCSRANKRKQKPGKRCFTCDPHTRTRAARWDRPLESCERGRLCRSHSLTVSARKVRENDAITEKGRERKSSKKESIIKKRENESISLRWWDPWRKRKREKKKTKIANQKIYYNWERKKRNKIFIVATFKLNLNITSTWEKKTFVNIIKNKVIFI